jgi:uracil-DNA glycosylase
VTEDELVDRLAAATIGATYNFYRHGEGAALRRERLARYLAERADAPVLLVAEAPGYRGTRVSGVPLTSERQLSGRGPAEATATTVQRTLRELGLERRVLLWNVVPTHPHLPGRPDTNRRPTRAEIGAARPFLAALTAGRRVVAVGRLAEAVLGEPSVRHPSHGGARAFRRGLNTIAAHDGWERSPMDEMTVREAAETHAQATVERDYETAGSYLSEDMKAAAGEVMRAMPRPLTGSEVLSVEESGGAYTARIRYSGDEGAATVDSRWEDVEGRPTIVGLDVVEGAS